MITKSRVRLGVKILLLGTFFILILSDTILASDITAKSCSASDIQAAINKCISKGGGTVHIPACADGVNGSTWSNGDSVCFYTTVELRIKGAGKDATVIKYVSGAKPPRMRTPCGGHPTGSPGPQMWEAHGEGFKELSDLTLSGNDDDAKSGGGTPGVLFIHACEGKGMTNVRIHDAKFLRPSHYGQSINICQNPNSTLLIDHVHIGEQHLADGARNWGNYGITVKGPNNEAYWVEPPEFGSQNAVYIEDSTFDKTYHPIAGFGATRLVVRHNTFHDRSSAIEQHGPSYGSISCCENQPNRCTGWGIDHHCYQGGYRVEVYDNTFYGPTYAILPRSGHWIITDNKFDSITNGGGAILLTMEPGSIGTNCDVAHGCPKARGWAGVRCNASPGCWERPEAIYIWNNTYVNMSKPGCATGHDDQCYGTQGDQQCVRVNTELFFRAPQAGDPEVNSYSKYQYPHPLASIVSNR